MKKLFFAGLAAAAMLMAAGCVDCGVWTNTPESLADKDISGVRLGLPVSVSNGKVTGMELAVFLAGSAKVSGLQFTLAGMNGTHELNGMQLGILNVADKPVNGVQLGLYNEFGDSGWQFGLVNCSSDKAAFQLGVFNYNENATVPFTILFNIGK